MHEIAHHARHVHWLGRDNAVCLCRDVADAVERNGQRKETRSRHREDQTRRPDHQQARGKRRAKEPRQVEPGRIDRQRRRQQFRWCQMPRHRQPRGKQHTGDRAKHRHHACHRPGCQAAGEIKQRKRHGYRGAGDLSPIHDLRGCVPVGQRPAPQRGQKRREKFGKRHRAEPCLGPGQFPSDPAHRDALHPEAGGHDQVARLIGGEGGDGEYGFEIGDACTNSFKRMRTHQSLINRVSRKSAGDRTLWRRSRSPSTAPCVPNPS